jgi:L-ascorbate metabolism protein UlaG (beta-lactamase superfamily)
MKKTYFIILIVGLMLQSCFTIKQSSLRIPNPESFKVDSCKISSTGAVYFNIPGIMKADFVSAGIKIEFDNLLLYIDPLVVDDTLKADYIFITHNHLDHFSKADYTKLTKPETIFIGPKTLSKKLKNHHLKTVMVGDAVDLGKVKYEVVDSYNLNSKLHKKGSDNVGYVLSLGDTRVYIAGDTDFIPEMEKLKNISVAIIPIGTGKTAMTPQAAAQAANLIQPRMVIPIHYKLRKNQEKEFKVLVDKNIEVKFFPTKEYE